MNSIHWLLLMVLLGRSGVPSILPEGRSGQGRTLSVLANRNPRRLELNIN